MVIVIEKLNMVVAAGIGLVSEAIAASRSKQEIAAQEQNPASDTPRTLARGFLVTAH